MHRVETKQQHMHYQDPCTVAGACDGPAHEGICRDQAQDEGPHPEQGGEGADREHDADET